MDRLVAVDAGTTSVRALAIDTQGRVLGVEARPLAQHYPSPGLVEHDPAEILALVDEALAALTGRLRDEGDAIGAIGITNQRETTVAFDRADGRMSAHAIVWQDRRTASQCAALAAGGHAPRVRELTGLTLDPYFSATKMRWLLEHGALDDASTPALCTVDTLVAWHLTGGAAGGTYATDHSNASRTLLYDLREGSFSVELCSLFGVPGAALPELRASCADYGRVAPGIAPGLEGVPVTAILGDQQAALFGLRCTSPGMAKATFGTGAFLLANAGEERPGDVDGLVTSVAWDLGAHGGRSFAREGSSFVAGAAIQWLRDELGLIERAQDVGALAGSVPDAGGACFVPALSGLGSPWWAPEARGALTGLSRGVGRAHVARAVVESLAYQARAMLDTMRAGGTALAELRVDGGAAQMDLLCTLLADGTRLTVRRPRSVEATAIGAALMAGVATGSVELEGLAAGFEEDRSFHPGDPGAVDAGFEAWLDAVGRAIVLGDQGARATYSST